MSPSSRDEIVVGTIVEERWPAHTPWASVRQHGEVIAADAESITVRWGPWSVGGQRIPRDRIGDKMTDLVRLPAKPKRRA